VLLFVQVRTGVFQRKTLGGDLQNFEEEFKKQLPTAEQINERLDRPAASCLVQRNSVPSTQIKCGPYYGALVALQWKSDRATEPLRIKLNVSLGPEIT
jgi:hypothetical protein